MVALLRNMGTIDQPWARLMNLRISADTQNCPHGRPTMRHLTKLDSGRGGRNGTSSRIDWATWSPPDV